MHDPKYFAACSSKDLAEKLVTKVTKDLDDTFATSIRSRIREAYDYYYAIGANDAPGLTGITRGGQQGELAEIRVNHARALVGALLNLVVAPQMVWQAKATNIDFESLKEVRLAASTLEYYWTTQGVKAFCGRAVEGAIAFLEGFILADWDDQLGDIVAPHPVIEGKVVRAGDIKLRNLYAWEVHRDSSKRSFDDLDWVIVETPQNRHDLAARYPLKVEEILSAPKEIQSSIHRPQGQRDEEGDDLTLYRFLHKPCAVLPWGREVRFLADGTVVYDDNCEIWPLHRVTPGELVGTPYGYSPFLEILGLQELYDNLSSSIATNQTTFAVQNIYLPHGTQLNADTLGTGMNIFEGSEQGGKPEAINLTATPAEVFNHLKTVKSDMELSMGLNATVRGEVQSDKLSGSAMALLQSQALQQSGVLQANYVRLVEQLGTTILLLIKKNASAPRQIALVGRSAAHLVGSEEISSSSFGKIQRVTVEVGNPMSQSPAGRVEMAKELIQMGLVKTPEQYNQVLTTGRLDPVTMAEQDELLNIASENDEVSKGLAPQALISDNHLLHGREHRTPVSNPSARRKPEVITAYIEHMKSHYSIFYGVPLEMVEMDPLYRERMLILTGQTPPPPMMPPGMVGPDGAPMGPPPAGPGAPPPQPAQGPVPPGGEAELPKMPNMPENPGVDPAGGVPRG